MEIEVYLINLDDRIDRLIQSEINSKKWGLVFHRVSAVPKLSLPASETSFATPEVVAAFRSHQKAFKLFLDSPAQFALILEDDFLPRKGFVVPKLEELLNIDADVLQLGYLHTSYIESVNIILINFRSLLMRIFRLFFANSPFGKRIISSKKLLSELERIPANLVPSDFRPGAHSYIVSEHLTCADIVVASHISTIDYFAEINWDKFPLIKEWYSIIKSRPSFRTILQDNIAGFTPQKDYANLDF